jgi:hypothetical protein
MSARRHRGYKKPVPPLVPRVKPYYLTMDTKAGAKAQAERRRKRRISLLKKAHEFSTICGADVYVVLRYKGKFYTYSSFSHPSWPPSRPEIVSYSNHLSKDGPYRRLGKFLPTPRTKGPVIIYSQRDRGYKGCMMGHPGSNETEEF